MILSSLFFLFIFMVFCTLLYFISKNTAYRNAVLIVFSLLFYAWGEPSFLWLILGSTLINFLFGKGISHAKGNIGGKFLLGLALVLNLGMLVGFKYTDFAVENLNNWFNLSLPVPDLPLPLGISFYTFRIVSYLIDCSWGKIKAERNFFRFLLYVSFFPITISGPIVRYGTMQDALANRQITIEDISVGLTRISIGLGKKVLLADNLSVIVDQFLGENLKAQTTLGVWYGVIVYALQMYFDFSGYSDMAIGISRMFGFKLEENFDHPFMCKDISEFWQRWHISLGTFFKDYLLYVPIFGRRRKYGGLFLVWICTGLWHGASWNYLIWGLYYGVILFFETLIGKKKLKKIPLVIRHILNKFMIIVGFSIFYCSGGISTLKQMFLGLFGQNHTGLMDTVLEASVRNNLFLLLAALICCFPLLSLPKKWMEKNAGANVCLSFIGTICTIAIFVVSCIFLVNATNTPFLYTKF